MIVIIERNYMNNRHRTDIRKNGIPAIKSDLWAWFYKDLKPLALFCLEVGTLSQHALAYCVRGGLLTPEQIKTDLTEPYKKIMMNGIKAISSEELERLIATWEIVKIHIPDALDYWFKDMGGARCRINCWNKMNGANGMPCGMAELEKKCQNDPETARAFKAVLSYIQSNSGSITIHSF